jgi:hypothetical protein
MNKYIKYLIPIVLLLYGVLEKINIHIPRMYSIDGYVFIAIGIFGVCTYIYVDFFKNINTDGVNQDRRILTLFCETALLVAIIYFSLYLFEVVFNDFLFILALLIFIICTLVRFKYMISRNN